MPTFYTGTHERNAGFFGRGRAIDPATHFIVSVNMFGNGLSSSPSNTPAPVDGPRFPQRLPVRQCRLPISAVDGSAQGKTHRPRHRLVDGGLPGLSMGRSVSAHDWRHPALLRVSENLDSQYGVLRRRESRIAGRWGLEQGRLRSTLPPGGLKAFGRVYAGWAYSQTFYREKLFQKTGFCDSGGPVARLGAGPFKLGCQRFAGQEYGPGNTAISAPTHYTGMIFAAALRAIQGACNPHPVQHRLVFSTRGQRNRSDAHAPTLNYVCLTLRGVTVSPVVTTIPYFTSFWTTPYVTCSRAEGSRVLDCRIGHPGGPDGFIQTRNGLRVSATSTI